jgi:phage pi2 protein 07
MKKDYKKEFLEINKKLTEEQSQIINYQKDQIKKLENKVMDFYDASNIIEEHQEELIKTIESEKLMLEMEMPKEVDIESIKVKYFEEKKKESSCFVYDGDLSEKWLKQCNYSLRNKKIYRLKSSRLSLRKIAAQTGLKDHKSVSAIYKKMVNEYAEWYKTNPPTKINQI